MRLIEDFISVGESIAFIKAYRNIVDDSPGYAGSPRLNQKTGMWVGGGSWSYNDNAVTDWICKFYERLVDHLDHGELYEPQWVVEYDKGVGLPLHVDSADNEGASVRTAILNVNVGIKDYVCEYQFVDVPAMSLLAADTSTIHGYAGGSHLESDIVNRYAILFRMDNFESEALDAAGL